MNTNAIINDYLKAVGKRAEMAGDGRLEYALGFILSTLQALKLQSYELDVLKFDTKTLDTLIEKA